MADGPRPDHTQPRDRRFAPHGRFGRIFAQVGYKLLDLAAGRSTDDHCVRSGARRLPARGRRAFGKGRKRDAVAAHADDYASAGPRSRPNSHAMRMLTR